MDMVQPDWESLRAVLFPRSMLVRVCLHILFWVFFLFSNLFYFIFSFMEIPLHKTTLIVYGLYYARLIPVFYLITATHSLLTRYMGGLRKYVVLTFSGLLYLHLINKLLLSVFEFHLGIVSLPEPFHTMAGLYLLPYAQWHIQDWLSAMSDLVEIQLLFFPLLIKTAKYGIWEAMIRRQLQQKSHHHELKALRSQLDPHFILNVINAAYAKVLPVSEKAASYLSKLANLLRYPLYDTSGEFIALQKEIEFTKEYIDLECLRHGERLKTSYKIDGEILASHQIPAVLLITLVENAIKHGVHSTTDACWIEIHLSVSNNRLTISVRNNRNPAKAKSQTKNSGIGIPNIRKRLELYFPNNHRFEIHEKTDAFEVAIELPLRKNNS